MNPFHKRPPLKKRHTKPCRFYQTARCPLSAEECDFAHVYSNEMPLQSPTPCRYYALGKCTNGTRCRYKHAISPSALGDLAGNKSDASVGANLRVRADGESEARIGGQGDDGGRNEGDITRGSQDIKSVLVSGDTACFSGMYPWYFTGPYLNAFASAPVYSSTAVPAAGLVGGYSYPQHPHPSGHPDVGSTPSTSTCSSLESPEDGIVTEDPKYSEHAHQHQSQIRITDEAPLVHIPPSFGLHRHLQPSHYFHPQHLHQHPTQLLSIDTSIVYPAPQYGAYALQMNLSPVSPTATAKKSRKSRSASRHKTANYKTKPCKFYRGTGLCPNGDECTFIHEDPKQPLPLPASPHDVSPVLSPKPLPPGLPSKPVSLTEENRKKNYFPISWRVIGGGVLIGGPRLDGSHAEEGEDPDVGVGGEDEKEAKAPSDSVLFLAEDTVPPSKAITRTRSSSNPPTPTNSHVKLETLFSAESPGNL